MQVAIWVSDIRNRAMTRDGYVSANSDATVADNMDILFDVRIAIYGQTRDPAIVGSNNLKPNAISDGNSFAKADITRITNKERLSDIGTSAKAFKHKAI